jgi:hypothetical protein
MLSVDPTLPRYGTDPVDSQSRDAALLIIRFALLLICFCPVLRGNE